MEFALSQGVKRTEGWVSRQPEAVLASVPSAAEQRWLGLSALPARVSSALLFAPNCCLSSPFGWLQVLPSEELA